LFNDEKYSSISTETDSDVCVCVCVCVCGRRFVTKVNIMHKLLLFIYGNVKYMESMNADDKYCK